MTQPIKTNNPCVINNGGTADEDVHLRDLFAAAALMGQEANTEVDLDYDQAAECAYKSADAMLAAREKS